MTAIIWESTALLSDSATGSSPASVQGITNSFDGESSEKLCLTFVPVAGTDPTAEVTLYLWDGTAYRRTGDTALLDPASDNFYEFNGGVYLAVTATISGSPTSWEIILGRRPLGV